MVITIYFDMDGVLAKWRNAKVKKTHKKKFFLRSKLQVNVRDTIALLNNNERFIINGLSHAYPDAHSAKNKHIWVQRKNVVFNKLIIVPYGENKADYAAKKGIKVLVDDNSKVLRAWCEKGPEYIGIKFYNGINGNNGTWMGQSISHEMTAEEMTRAIIKIIDDAVSERKVA